jgi:hypothetical protein
MSNDQENDESVTGVRLGTRRRTSVRRRAPRVVHAAGDRVSLTREGEPKRELDLGGGEPPVVPEPAATHIEVPAPGTSPLDDGLAALRERFGRLMTPSDEEES